MVAAPGACFVLGALVALGTAGCRTEPAAYARPPAEARPGLPVAPTAPTAALRVAPPPPSVASPQHRVPAPAAPGIPMPPSVPTSPVAPLVRATPAPAPATAPAPPTSVNSEPRTFAEWVERLRRDAASGADAGVASHASLLDALARHVPTATADATIVRVPELEAAALARHGGGLGFATITSYLEPGGDAAAMRRVYLDFDRVPEFTGKPGTRTLAREPDAVLGRADAIRKTLGFEYGARWTFRARPVDRGAARLIVSSQVEAVDTAHMIFTQGLWIGVPEGDGVRVAEIAVSVMDYAVPPLLAGIAEQTVRREMLARTNGLRAHWREYVR